MEFCTLWSDDSVLFRFPTLLCKQLNVSLVIGHLYSLVSLLLIGYNRSCKRVILNAGLDDLRK